MSKRSGGGGGVERFEYGGEEDVGGVGRVGGVVFGKEGGGKVGADVERSVDCWLYMPG